VPHTATADTGFDSKNLNSGQSWSFVARQKGNYPYVCTYHPYMKGELLVK
jgi:plastocyanin